MSAETSSASTTRLSKDATPFIPTFMRTAVVSAPSTSSQPAMVPTDANEETREDDDAPVASWGQFIADMQEVEIEMLIDMMPAEVQMTYNEALHRANKSASSHTHLPDDADATKEKAAQAYQDAPNGEERRRRAVEAATSTFSELSADQLFFLEEFLHDDDGAQNGTGTGSAPMTSFEAFLEGAAGGDVFGNGEDDMNSEEEEWLLEQMMMGAPARPTAGSNKPPTNTQKTAKRTRRGRK